MRSSSLFLGTFLFSNLLLCCQHTQDRFLLNCSRNLIFTFKQSLSLYLNCISCRQHTSQVLLFIHYENLCLFIGMQRSFITTEIIYNVRFKSIILLFVIYFPHMFIFPFFLSRFILDCVFFMIYFMSVVRLLVITFCFGIFLGYFRIYSIHL